MRQYLLTGFADEISPDLGRQTAVLRRLNMEYMEIRGVNGRGIDTYSEAEAKEIRKVLDGSGIKVSSLASPIGKTDVTGDFSGHFDHFKHVAELAHILDTRYIRIFSFFIPKGHRADDYRASVFERMDRLVSYAEAERLTLLHENEKGIYGDSPERCRILMEEFYGDSFRAVFDFANFVQCGQDTKRAWEMMKPYIEYVHVKDARALDKVVVPAGEGDGRIAEILGEIIGSGYEGFLSLEPHLTEFPGLEMLEREGESLHGMRAMDGEEAFIKGYHALAGILGLM